MQVEVQASLQQTPSVQYPLSQAAPVLQGSPSATGISTTHAPSSQKNPSVQSVSFKHVSRHASAVSHAYPSQLRVFSSHLPAPLHRASYNAPLSQKVTAQAVVSP
jgi:hypothetical protein